MQTQKSPRAFDAIEWIGTRAPSLQRFLGHELQPLLHFALMWNMFEGQLCDSSASVPTLEEVAARLAQRGFATHPAAESFKKFIQDRYFTNGTLTDKFHSLRLRSDQERTAVLSAVSGKAENPSDIIFAQLLVVYRYRNNTFHGLKEIAEVFGSQVLFDEAARYLGAVLDVA